MCQQAAGSSGMVACRHLSSRGSYISVWESGRLLHETVKCQQAAGSSGMVACRHLSNRDSYISVWESGRLLHKMICKQTRLAWDCKKDEQCEERRTVCSWGMLVRSRWGMLVCRWGMLVRRWGMLVCWWGMLVRRESWGMLVRKWGMLVLKWDMLVRCGAC